MWYEFFVVFGLWWWIALAVEICFLMFFVVNDYGKQAFWAIIIYLGAMHLFGDMHLFDWLKNHPVDLLRYGFLYLLAGAIFAWGKICGKAHDLKEMWAETKKSWIDSHTDKYMNAEEKELVWLDHVQNDRYSSSPVFSDYKNDIIFWISYWPLHLIWMVLHDFLKNLGKQVYRLFSRIYEASFNSIVGSITSDINKAKTVNLPEGLKKSCDGRYTKDTPVENLGKVI